MRQEFYQTDEVFIEYFSGLVDDDEPTSEASATKKKKKVTF